MDGREGARGLEGELDCAGRYLSFETDGRRRLIELKATEYKTQSSIVLTENEWKAARAPETADAYCVYLVTDALTVPKIEILHDPAAWVADGKLQIEPSVFRLSLRSST